jgi:arylsulfatase A-like enzyme
VKPPDQAPAPGAPPKNAIVVLLDSLNRHMLGAYGGREFETPNIDRFAAGAVRFDHHFVGSLPCMPARHDILCGALDFLWKPWGSIELWEEPITAALRAKGVTTMLVSDHPHLFETGGENYHTDFTAWDYVRGHEGDPWKTLADPSWIGAPALPARRGYLAGRGGRRVEVARPYDASRTWFRDEADFPGPRTMAAASRWLEDNAGRHDRFLLFVDEFDPHEPFDTPAPWAGRYDPDWKGELMIWPPYAVAAVASGVLSGREARQVRANYGAKLAMIDHWFGALMATVERLHLAPDTVVILCTDHGHFLGEKDIFGKPGVPHYEPIGHTPLMIAWPGAPPRAVEALSTNVDIHATLADIFDVAPRHRTHGRSLAPLVTGEEDRVRDWALAGVFGRWVHVVDQTRKYARAPVGDDDLPLSMWSNRWSTMPTHVAPWLRLPRPDRRARLDFMPGSDVPVIRQRFERGDPLPYWCAGQVAGDHHCYRPADDPEERDNRLGGPDERDMIELLRVALADVEAPADQFERLGIA